MAIDRMSIYYRPDDYYPASSRIYGRMDANAGFIRGVYQYGRRSALGFYVEEENHFHHIQNQLSRFQLAHKLMEPIYHGDVLSLNRYDLYFAADPMISRSAWARAMLNPKAYSLCGLTHSFSSFDALQEIGKLILAPIEPWDALVCTSHTVKNVIEEIFRQWYDYLKHYRQMSFECPLQLPVIPLGIHVNEVSKLADKPLLRKKFRERWQITEDDFVVLFHGRLSFYEKAHPVPMYLALEKFAKRVKQNHSIYFVQAGWFANMADQEAYKQSLKLFSPSIRSLFLLDMTEQDKLAMWCGADVFISLVDNIQETFGLTPLAAMANELPVVVSDWDGYKDTVRHEIDGFRIPSCSPPPGCGFDLALGYLTNAINYHTYCGLNAQMTSIDVEYCAEVLWQLYASPNLRQQMGKAGRANVLKKFDWAEIIKQYDNLWDALSERRREAQSEKHLPLLSQPLLTDPFLTYAKYATQTLNGSHILNIDDGGYHRLNNLEAIALCHFGSQQRLPKNLIIAILDVINARGAQTVKQLIDHILKIDPAISQGIVLRTLTYLMKFGILK